MALNVPNTAMAVAIDVGDGRDCHPFDKREIGRRLSLAARALTYGEKISYSGPLYASMKVEDGRIRVCFQHADDGLVAKDGGPLRGFSIAGQDREFVPAQARIEGDTVVASSEQVTQPVAVRYAWADSPECNLHNGAGLPASPFRTDDWPGITKDAR